MKTFLLAFCLLSCITLNSQTIYVNANASGSNDGNSWANAYTNLQTAIDNAVAESSIWIAKGSYTPGAQNTSFTLDKKLNIYGGFSGSENNLADRDVASNPTVLSGDNNGDDVTGDLATNRSDNSIHVIILNSNSSGSLIDGFTIKGGHTKTDVDNDDPDGIGGGMLNLSTAIQLNSCNFTENVAQNGGAFGNKANAAEAIEIVECTFQNNLAQYGGAISSFEEGVQISIERCSLINNVAMGSVFSSGGAIYAGDEIELVVGDSHFEDNQALDYGGAIALFNDAVSTFINTSFKKNTITDNHGGAVSYSLSRGTHSFTECTFEDNNSGGFGGAIHANLDKPYQLSFHSSVFKKNNSTSSGGAIYLNLEFSEDATKITDCDFSENTSGGFGGAVSFSGTQVEITESDFQKNSAPLGGAVSAQLSSSMLIASNCNFDENETTGFGGAIEIHSSASSIITNSSFKRNKAIGGSGGAISFDFEKTGSTSVDFHRVDACVFDGNQASFLDDGGGAGSAIIGFNSDILITNSLFINQVSDSNGTIYVLAFNSIQEEVTITNCTFANNDNGGSSTLRADDFDTDDRVIFHAQNNIFADQGDGFSNFRGEASFDSFGGNLSINNTISSILTHEKDLNETDPLFKNATDDFRLSSNSPAINAGVNNGAPEKDLVGYDRDDLIDIGAYESQEVSGLFDPLPEVGNLSIFPNPVDAILNYQLESEWQGNLEVSIEDITGKTIWKRIVTKDTKAIQNTISTIQLHPGTYLLRLSANGMQSTKMFVKQ